MQFTTLFTLAGLAVLASAQQTYTVLVGDGGALAFSPSNITGVNPGDKVSFEFRAKNHTATQSTFTAPCVPGTFNGSAGADSGFAFIPPNNTLQAGQFPTWTITVNSTAPIWFHCAQTNPKSHCQAGMVFSINANANKTFDQFLANAMASNPSTVSAGSASTTDPSISASNSTSVSSSNSTSVSSDPSAAGNATTIDPSLDPAAANSTTDATGSSTNGTSTSAPSESVIPAAAAPASAASSGVANAGAASADQSNTNTTTAPNGNGAASVSVSKAAGLLVAVVFGAVMI